MTLICVEAADQQQGLSSRKTSDGFTHDSPFPIRLLAREIQRNGEHINIGERTRQPATPIFEVSPICGRRRGNQSALHAGGNLKEQKKARERTVAIETYADLRGDVREQERLIHGFLRATQQVRNAYDRKEREKVASRGT